MRPGAVVAFGDTANLYSPADTWILTEEDGGYTLSVTGLMGGNFSFDVSFPDENTMVLSRKGKDITLQR